jgi:succinate dehydrogenase/fumarate reductase flavoprotein subunit
MQDVLVIGFGPAGAAAAIAAHDAGARVEILEKTTAGGGNCLYSGGFLCETASVDHLDALCFGKTPRDVLAAFASGLRELPAWLEQLGGAAPVVDWPPSWPHFPGRVTYRRFAAEPPGPGLFALLRENVERRGIPVRYGTPATALDRDGDRVIGANGIRARAVILAAGGFEYDADLRDAHLPLPLSAVGHPGNTGDAVRLAQSAGASLRHMSAFFG